MKLGRRLYNTEERLRTAIGSMVNGTIGGDSKIGMPIVETVRLPLAPPDSEHIAFGEWTEGVEGAGSFIGGTITQSYGGVYESGGYVVIPAALFNAGGTVNFHYTIAVGSDVSDGAVWVQMREQVTNFGLGKGEDFFFDGSQTPGTTVIEGTFDFPVLFPEYEATHDVQLEIVVSGTDFGPDDSYWEVVFP